MAEVTASSPIVAALSGQPAAQGKAAEGGGGPFSQLLAGQMADSAKGAGPEKGLPLTAMLAQAGAPGLAGLFTALAKRLGRTEGEDAALLGADPAVQSAQGAALLAMLAGTQQGADPGVAVDPDALAQQLLSLGGAGLKPSSGRSAKAADLAASGKVLPGVELDAEASEGAKAAPGGSVGKVEVKAGTAGESLLKLTGSASVDVGGEGVKDFGQLLMHRAPGATLLQSSPNSGEQHDPSLIVTGVGQSAAVSAAEEAPLMGIRTPVRAPGWEADLGQKLVWLAGRQSQFAELSLNPPHLGSIEVRLSLSGHEAGAQFFSPHASVRDAIESAIPRLREMMAQAGLSLGQTSVSQESFRGQQETGSGHRGFAQAGITEAGIILDSQERPLVGRGLVDLFV